MTSFAGFLVGLVFSTACCFAINNSIDVCIHTEHRHLFGDTLKYCGSVERVIVTCFESNRATYFGSVIYNFIPEIVPGTAVISVKGSDCTSVVSRAQSMGVGLVVFGDKKRNVTANQILLRVKGEVFESHACPTKSMNQVVAFRALSADHQCNWLHFLQFTKFLHDNYPADARERLFSKTLRSKTRAEAASAAAVKTHFAGFGFGKFRLGVYHGDYVVRHVFTELLRRREIGTIHALGGFSRPEFTQKKCPGDFTRMSSCLLPYKFAIVMENSNFPGYVSEKLLNAFLASAIPIYFGAENIFQYFNERAMIVCRVSNTETAVLRAAHKNNYPMLKTKSAREIIDWATTIIEPSLDACLEQVEQVATDDEAYLQMLAAHPLAQMRPNRTYVDGYDGACQLVKILEAAHNFFGANHTRSRCHETLNLRGPLD